MNDHEILEKIYQIYYCGKMFNKDLLIEVIRQDHEKAIRFNKFVEGDDFAKAHDCVICRDKISYQIDKHTAKNVKSASMGWICRECEAKAVRYEALQDRYLNQNEKHFEELCGLYFEDEKI